VSPLLHGHPDDWWDGHDWETWWARLRDDQRDDLLDLGWGDQPYNLGIVLTSLRGATHEVVEVLQSTPDRLRCRTVITRHPPTDDFLVWLEEKRAAALDAPGC